MWLKPSNVEKNILSLSPPLEPQTPFSSLRAQTPYQPTYELTLNSQYQVSAIASYIVHISFSKDRTDSHSEIHT